MYGLQKEEGKNKTKQTTQETKNKHVDNNKTPTTTSWGMPCLD